MEHTDTLQPHSPVRNDQAATAKLREQAHTVGDDVRQMGNLAREAASEQYLAAKEAASHYIEEGKSRVQEYQNEVNSYVRRKPVKAVLLATGIGAILGLLWSRR